MNYICNEKKERFIYFGKFIYFMVTFYTYLGLYLDDLNKWISLSEFEKYFKKPHQTIKVHLKKFVDLNVLIIEKKERFLFYKLNLDNPLTKEHLILCEKERMIDLVKKNVLFSRLYNTLSNYFNDSKCLIFGSSVLGKQFNDIDLLVLSKNKNIKKEISNFEKTYSQKIHLILTDEKSLTKIFRKEIMKKHIIFNSHEYFFEVLYNVN